MKIDRGFWGSNRGLRWLLAILAFVVVAALLAWLITVRSGEWSEVDRIAMAGRLEPVWPSGSTVQRGTLPAAGGDVEIYIDHSVPMGGFTTAPAGQGNPLVAVVQGIGESLSAAYVGSDVRLRWLRVGESIAELPEGRPRLGPKFFSGTASRIQLAMDAGIASIRSGNSRAAVLVSDLHATGQIEGASEVARALSGWLASDEVLSGEVQVGLIGLRLPYWGVTGRCSDARPGLGCWFSEDAQRWRPLSRIARVPVFALVLARGLRSEELGRALESLVPISGGEPDLGHMVVLTRDAETKAAQWECSVLAPGLRRVPLLRSATGELACRPDATLEIRCESRSFPDGLSLTSARAGWTSREIAVEGASFRTEARCQGLASALGEDGGSGLAVQVTARRVVAGESPPSSTAPDWSAWSSVEDTLEENLDKTVGLSTLIEMATLRASGWQGTVMLSKGESQESSP